LIAEEPVTLNATESKVISASWRTGAAYGGVGYRNITAVVDLHNHSVETNETNNTLIERILVNGTDLAVTAIEMPCGLSYDNLCYVGQDVNVTATIANIGAIDAANFMVIFRDGTCSEYGDVNRSGNNFTEVHIERLNSGESRNISVIWNPKETGWHTINASIPYDEYTDNNGTNNELSGFSCVESRYDFLVESVNVEPKDVRRGESVNITATIGNIGHASKNVSIAFFVNSTDYAGTCGERFIRIRTLDYVYAEVGENKTVSITWDVDVAGGSHLIAAVVNPDNEIEEIAGSGTRYDWGLIRFRGNNTGNNVKNCTLHVIPNDLNITDLTLDPAGPNICEIVDLSAAIKNNEDADAESTIRFHMEHNVSQPMYSVPSWSTHQQPEDVMIRVHFNYIKWGWAGAGHPDSGGRWSGTVRAYVNGSYDQRKQIYFYFKNEDGEMEKVPYIDESMPCTESKVISRDWYWRHWYDVWTEWSCGDEIEISLPTENTKPGWISIDCYQVRLGNRTVTLRPGESMAYPGAWNASPPIRAGEHYRLMASVDDQKMYSEETYLGGTDLTVTNLSVTPVALDGDMVWINATIENLGRMDATDFIVNVSEVYRPEEVTDRINVADNIELLNTTHVDGLDVGNSIHISVLWNASIREIECEGDCWDGNPDLHVYRPCSWTEIADDYIINVTINPLESTPKEENDTNNIKEADVQVDSSRDFEVTDISFYVNNESRDPSELVIYDDLTMNATLKIINNLNRGGSVNVSFYIDETCDEHEIGNTTVVFPAENATCYTEIEWKVENFDGVDITGEHDITVVVDPENRIYEIDDVNNTYTQPIHVRASDLLVERIEINPESPLRGETASINVTMRNNGDADANNLTLKIYDWAERHIEDVDERCGVGCKQMVITRADATAMRLYLDLEVEKDRGEVCIKDNSSGREIVCYDENFHGWTPWVLSNSTAVVPDSACARVSKVYHIASSGVINTSTHDIKVNKTKNITIDWNASTVGERFIVAIVDPDDCIIESNESNNRLVEFTSVQTRVHICADRRHSGFQSLARMVQWY
jgi:subtilase family serine protease